MNQKSSRNGHYRKIYLVIESDGELPKVNAIENYASADRSQNVHAIVRLEKLDRHYVIKVDLPHYSPELSDKARGIIPINSLEAKAEKHELKKRLVSVAQQTVREKVPLSVISQTIDKIK